MQRPGCKRPLDGGKNVTDKHSDIQTNTEYENRGPSNL